jgi:hypothetical protein
MIPVPACHDAQQLVKLAQLPVVVHVEQKS